MQFATSVLLLESACGPQGTPSTASKSGERLIGTPVFPEWEVRERRVEQAVGGGRAPHSVAFRAGDGLAALLTRDPPATWQFMYVKPRYPAGGPIGRGARVIEPTLGNPVDIVGMSDSGVTWYLDSSSSRVISKDVGAQTAVVTTLQARGAVRRACKLGNEAIAYLDDAQPLRVWIQALDKELPPRSLRLPIGVQIRNPRDWSELRFGGSVGGPCVIWAPSLRSAVIVTASTLRVVELSVSKWDSPSFRSRSAAWLRGTREPPVVLDATSIPLGVAILSGGRSVDAGRIVDFYDSLGVYVESMQLPRTALRIAGSRYRLLVFGQSADSLLLSSFVLPAPVRGVASGSATQLPFVPKIDGRVRSDSDTASRYREGSR